MRLKYFKITVSILSTALFLTAVFLVMILAQGRTVGNTGEIIQTGIIRINTNLSDFLVFINGEKHNLKNKRVENLTSSTYNLEIFSKGFRPWNKNVEVIEGKITDISPKPILKNLIIETIFSDDILSYSFSDDGASLYYIKYSEKEIEKNGLWELRLKKGIFDFSNRINRLGVFEQEEYQKLLEINFDFTLSNDKQILILKPQNEKSIPFVQDSEVFKEFIFINKIGFEPDFFDFFDNNSSIVLEKNNFLFEYFFSDNSLHFITYTSGSSYKSYDFSKNYLVFVKDQILYEYTNKKANPILFPEKLDYPKNILKTLVSDSYQKIFAIETENELYYVNLQEKIFELVAVSGKPIFFSQNGLSLLFSVEKDIYSFNIEKLSGVREYKININKIPSFIIDTFSFSKDNKNILVKDAQGHFGITDFDGENYYELLEIGDINFKKAILIDDTIYLPKSGNQIFELIKITLSSN